MSQQKKRTLLFSAFLLIVMLACNVPAGQPPEGEEGTEEPSSSDGLALTVTAQALLLSATPEFTATPQFTPTPEFTATPSVPEVTVSTNTNCRAGPSTQFDNIDSLLVTQKAEIVGKNTPTGYWIIKRLNGSGTCWLYPQYATVSGNTANLPEYPVPPTPTPSLPAAVKNLDASVSCSPSGTLFFNDVHVHLVWTDVANNEQGYRIYQNGSLIATLSENATSFDHDTGLNALWLVGDPQPSHKYAVEAYNSAGASDKKNITIKCP